MATHPASTRLGRRVHALNEAECWQRIAISPIGRLVFVDNEGHPLALPVNHAVTGHTIVFRTVAGSKLAAAAQERPVTYEVDHFDEDLHAGWSVLVKGHAELVVDSDELEHLHGGRLESWAAGGSDPVWVRITAREVTGLELLPRGE